MLISKNLKSILVILMDQINQWWMCVPLNQLNFLLFPKAYSLDFPRVVTMGLTDLGSPFGGVVEWLMALVLKTSDVRASVGSNPTPSVQTLKFTDFISFISKVPIPVSPYNQ